MNAYQKPSKSWDFFFAIAKRTTTPSKKELGGGFTIFLISKHYSKTSERHKRRSRKSMSEHALSLAPSLQLCVFRSEPIAGETYLPRQSFCRTRPRLLFSLVRTKTIRQFHVLSHIKLRNRVASPDNRPLFLALQWLHMQITYCLAPYLGPRQSKRRTVAESLFRVLFRASRNPPQLHQVL